MADLKINMAHLIGTVMDVLPKKADVETMVQHMASIAHAKWSGLAQSKLSTSKTDYVAGIQPAVELRSGSFYGFRISLEGDVPNMVEHGWPAHDLRGTVIPTAKTKHSGPMGDYVHVPYRHGTAGSQVGNVGHTMPAAIHRAAKFLAPFSARHMKEPDDQHRLRPDALPKGLSRRTQEMARQHLTTKAKPWHSTSLYTDMVRHAQAAKNQSGQQSRYMTWRTISTNPETMTDPNKWMHPGIQARNIAPQVQDYITQQLSNMLTQTLLGSTKSGEV